MGQGVPAHPSRILGTVRSNLPMTFRGGLGFRLVPMILWPLAALGPRHSGGIKDPGLRIGGTEKREQQGGAEGQLQSEASPPSRSLCGECGGTHRASTVTIVNTFHNEPLWCVGMEGGGPFPGQ